MSERLSIGDFLNPRRWQLEYLFDLGFQGWSTHIAIVCLTFLTQKVSYAPMQWWLVGMVSLSGLLAALCRYASRQRQIRSSHLTFYGWTHTFLTTLVGIFWGAGALISAQLGETHFLVFTLALGGTALGAVSAQHSVLRSNFASLWTSIPILAYAHAINTETQFGWTTPLMMLLFGAVISTMAFRMHRFLLSNHQLTESMRLKNEQMADLNVELTVEREKADAANLAKSRFLAHASHDLRQPVHAIAMLTSNLQAQIKNREARELLREVDGSVATLTSLMQSLLDLSALDVGQVTVQNEAVEVGRLLDELSRINRPRLVGTDIELRFVKTNLWIETDQNLMVDILQNLIGNAIKYSNQGKILCGLKRRGENFSFIVVDQGIGISEEEQERIFSEFYRGSAIQTGSIEGLGLGLTIVAKLTELMGLRCKLTSTRTVGTCVEVGGLKAVLPVKRAGNLSAPMHRLAGMHVLVLDDDLDVLRATTGLLEAWGCKVTGMSEEPDEQTEIDLVILDNLDPSGGPIDAMVKRIRDLEKKEIPVVIVSADDLDVSGLPKAVAMQKPLPANRLRAVMTSLALSR